jgi:hypothetical protein
MNSINKSTPIHIFVIANGIRHYLVKPDTKRNDRGEIVLWPVWSSELKDSRPLTYEMAHAFRERYTKENKTQVHFTLQAGGEVVDDKPLVTQTEDYTKRVPMIYRGLLAVPGFDARNQMPCWYVRFPDTSIESLRAPTVEEAVDKVYERPDLLPHAERGQAQVAEPEAPRKPAGPRIRPGDLR